MPGSTPSFVRLQAPGLSADIDPLGAQLVQLRDEGGRDLLWHGDPQWWSGRAPILFPIVGTLAGGAYRLAGETRPLPRHGFARVSRFELTAQDDRSASFRLRDDAATRAVYPFGFELQLHYRLQERSLACIAMLRNPGDIALPASIGFHPGFAWPLPYGGERGEHGIEFAQAEPDPARRLTRDGLLAAQPVASPVAGRHLALTDALFEPDVLILDRIRSRQLRYGVAGRRQLEIGFPEARELGIWTRPGAPFVCIEPWQGHSDPEDYQGDFPGKPGVFQVPAGSAHRHSMTIAIDPP